MDDGDGQPKSKLGHDVANDARGHAGRSVIGHEESFGRLFFRAAAVGLDLSGWDADRTGARLFLNAIARRHDGASGGL